MHLAGRDEVVVRRDLVHLDAGGNLGGRLAQGEADHARNAVDRIGEAGCAEPLDDVDRARRRADPPGDELPRGMSARVCASSSGTSSGATRGALTDAQFAPWMMQIRPSSNRLTDDPATIGANRSGNSAYSRSSA